ncbi:hypothetical protein Pmani_031555 [Petrolisthes manimaculis]|uniref:MADF domain-containing protein n=1 Tax=Petrolisthes manimaculis TaxID=1843537 RepID=A0AAE1TUQ5_9EUCA|nr:hypothetical protein Pmani_031555 [Petrolisthes manimaculis]
MLELKLSASPETPNHWQLSAASCFQEKPHRKVMWSTEATHQLLECVREFPILWDPGHEYFSKTLLKKEKWSEVASQLQLEFPEMAAINLNAGDVQAKFATIKGSFQREVKKLQNIPTGLRSGIKLRWQFFKACLFMLPHYDVYSTTATFTLPPSKEEPLQDEPDEVLSLQPSPSSSSSLSTVSSPSPSTSSASPSSHKSKPPSSPPRKKKKVTGGNLVIEKNNESVNSLDALIVGQKNEKPDIIQKTVSAVTSFMSMVSEKRKKAIAANIMNVLVNEPQFSPDEFE